MFLCIEYDIKFNVRSVSRGIWRCRQAFSGQQQHFIIVLENCSKLHEIITTAPFLACMLVLRVGLTL